MMGEEMTTSDPFTQLEQRIGAGFAELNTRFSGVEARLTRVETRLTGVGTRLAGIETQLKGVETRLTGVETRLTGVETRLTGVEIQLKEVDKRLTRVEILAKDTNKFCKSMWDSQTSLERHMNEGFGEAKKERTEHYRLLSRAIQGWGERVGELETRPVRTTKRRR